MLLSHLLHDINLIRNRLYLLARIFRGLPSVNYIVLCFIHSNPFELKWTAWCSHVQQQQGYFPIHAAHKKTEIKNLSLLTGCVNYYILLPYELFKK